MAREDQAALLGSEYERWIRADVQAPIWLPPRFSALRPPSVNEILGVLERGTRSKLALGTIGNLHEVRERLPTRARARLADCQPRKIEEDRADEERGGKARSTCDCCNGYARASDTQPARLPEHHCDKPALAQDGSYTGVQSDPPVIQFDQDTWQTTITESIVIPLVTSAVPHPESDPSTLDVVRRVLRMSSPENWARSSAGQDDRFFLHSIPGTWDKVNAEFIAAEPRQLAQDDNRSDDVYDPLPKWAEDSGGELMEVTSWPAGLSNTSKGGATIIITISDYQDNIGDRTPPSATPSLKFQYALHHCIDYDAGGFQAHDIMDIDGGSFEGKLEDGKLVIQAKKSVHFRPSNPSDGDLAVVLNLIAPATTALLMRELVYTGTLRLLNAAVASEGEEPAPPTDEYGGHTIRQQSDVAPKPGLKPVPPLKPAPPLKRTGTRHRR